MTWEELIVQTGRVLVGNTASRPQRSPGTALPTLNAWHQPRPVSQRQSEDDEQRALFVWRDTVLPLEPRLDLLHHIPNGKQRSKAVAGQLKALGVLRHIPDLFLPVARHGFHGFYDELKALDGTVPPGQKGVHARLREQGYFVAVSFGWIAAAQALCQYLDRGDLARQLGEAP